MIIKVSSNPNHCMRVLRLNKPSLCKEIPKVHFKSHGPGDDDPEDVVLSTAQVRVRF